MSVQDDHDTPPPPDLHLVDGERPPPPATRNPVAERAVLGVLLSYPALAEKIHPELTAADFHDPHHGTIWDAIHTVAAAGTIADFVTVAGQLHRTGDLGTIGGPAYLQSLASDAPVAVNATAYCRDVRDAARLRSIDTAATRLRQLAATPDPAAIEVALSRAIDTIDQAFLRFGPASSRTLTGLHDLTWVATGDWPVIEPPTWGKRTDGHALFYSGRVNGIFGDPESAKTWLAKKVCIEAMDAGRQAAIVDVDHNGRELTVSHLLLLGADPQHLADPATFRYYEPEDGDELKAAVAEIASLTPAVVVLDSIGEMLPMLGVKSVDNDEVTAALRLLAQPAATAGSCVITIDHLPKDREARNQGWAIGAGAKKRALNGSYIRAETLVAPAPGRIGKVALKIEKDRVGGLRATCQGKYIGQLVLDSTGEATTATVGPSDAITPDGKFRPTYLMDSISRLVEDTPDVNLRSIEASVHGKKANIREALDILITEHHIAAIPGRNRAILHRCLKPYRETDDTPQEPPVDPMF